MGKALAHSKISPLPHRKSIEIANHLYSITDTATDAIFSIDHKGTIIFANQAVQKLFGYSSEELIGENIVVVMPERFRSQHSRALEKFLKTGKKKIIGTTIELEAQKKDKTIFPIELSLSEWRNENAIYITGIIRDLTESQRLSKELSIKNESEDLVLKVSRRFNNLKHENTDETIIAVLQKIAEFTNVDRASIFIMNADKKLMSCTHEWCADGIDPQIKKLKDVPVDLFPWFLNEAILFRAINIPRMTDLPPEAAAEKTFCESEQIRSLLNVPLVYEQELIGFVAFHALSSEKEWPPQTIPLLKIIGDILLGAIKRQRDHQDLSEQEEMYRLSTLKR